MFKYHNSIDFGLYDHNLTLLFIFSILERRNGHKEEIINESHHENLDHLVWKTKR